MKIVMATVCGLFTTNILLFILLIESTGAARPPTVEDNVTDYCKHEILIKAVSLDKTNANKPVNNVRIIKMFKGPKDLRRIILMNTAGYFCQNFPKVIKVEHFVRADKKNGEIVCAGAEQWTRTTADMKKALQLISNNGC